MKKETLYLLLGIGAAYWYWMKYMKSNTMDKIVSPVLPSNPTPEYGTIQTMVYNNPDQDHTTQNVYSNAGTYQNFYGSSVNGTPRKVPTLC